MVLHIDLWNRPRLWKCEFASSKGVCAVLYLAMTILMMLCGCQKPSRLVERIRAGDQIVQLTFGVTRNGGWSEECTLTNAAALEFLSKQVALSRIGSGVGGRYHEGRFVMRSGYSEEVIVLVHSDCRRVTLLVNYGYSVGDDEEYILEIPPEAPESLKSSLALIQRE